MDVGEGSTVAVGVSVEDMVSVAAETVAEERTVSDWDDGVAAGAAQETRDTQIKKIKALDELWESMNGFYWIFSW